LFDVRVLLLELIGESEGDHREPGIVIGGGLTLLAGGDLSFDVFGLTLGSMDVAGYRSASRYVKKVRLLIMLLPNTSVPSCGFQCLRQEARIVEGVFHNSTIACEA
jgi:hypothetical protein